MNYFFLSVRRYIWKVSVVYIVAILVTTTLYTIPYSLLFFFFFEIHVLLFIYLWLCWVFVSVRGPSPVAASGDHSSSRRAGLSPSRPLPLRSTGSRRAGSAIVAHEPGCSVACGIFPDRGSNPRPPHRQADSQPLRHQGRPYSLFIRQYLFSPYSEHCWNKFLFTSFPSPSPSSSCLPGSS